MRASWFGVALLAVGLAWSVGCGGESEQETPAPQAGKAGSPAAVPAPSTGQGALPANFPADVPRHPKASIEKTTTTPEMGMTVDLLVEDDFDDVSTFYADGFAAQGWSTDIKETSEGVLIFADKGNRTAAAIVEKSDDGARVNLVLSEFPR